MSAGSGASNLGYGNTSPFSNINGGYVNVDSSNWPGRFGSNEIQGKPPGPLPGLAGTQNNVDAAAGIYPGSSIIIKGGAKKLKRKIKNITKHYKMKGGSRGRNSLRNKLKLNYSRSLARTLARVGGKRTKRRRGGRKHKRSHRQRGGYSQYENNLPMTQTYQVAGVNLPANQLALANPPPFKVLPNTGNCVDNLNAYTMKGFPSRGH
jgi:hypothetical protein